MESLFTDENIAGLKKVTPLISKADEGGYTYIKIEDLILPPGCKPTKTNALLCVTPRDGYNSRLFFAEKVSGSVADSRNWNGKIRVLGENWEAMSWNVPIETDFASLLLIHLRALRHVQQS
jgi:hypothetical protein